MNMIAKVHWLDGAGALTNDVARAAYPCMRISVAARLGGQFVPVIALIDTGLSRTSVSVSMLHQMGARRIGSATLSGSGGWRDHGIYEVDVKVEGVPATIGLDAVSLDYPLGETGIAALVGIDVLRMGRLVLQPADLQSRFEFLRRDEPTR